MTTLDNPTEAITRTLTDLRVKAGTPSLRTIAETADIAATTVADVLKRPGRTTWISVRAVAAALDHPDPDALRVLHGAAKAEHAAARPDGPAGTAYLIVTSADVLHQIVIGDSSLAHTRAQRCAGIVIAAPIIADYRT